MYFQRFFLKEEEREFDALRIGMASVLLATKVAEEPRPVRDILNAFSAKSGRSEVAKSMEMEVYWSLRDEVLLHEQALLRAMAFDVAPTQAYTFLMEFAWLLGCGPEHHEVVTLAWSLLNDAFCSDVCALCAPGRIATASMLLAIELARRVPALRPVAEWLAGRLDELGREPRLEDFVGIGPSSGGAEVEAICRDLLSLYEADLRRLSTS